ncbi:expressed unknown protein [Ectocarpus siliculosus]|uniref:Uncharacterized protein n=1 Tax=Ectocarpus siliculosus TaxID=2880 RepID=D7FUL5_ECTSI|nr:expressed unknown protein [Ectocarpus siliculosus]|eukprot:CBJ31671.1 expressed unknown protein [Ectocarpus siliculosus]
MHTPSSQDHSLSTAPSSRHSAEDEGREEGRKERTGKLARGVGNRGLNTSDKQRVMGGRRRFGVRKAWRRRGSAVASGAATKLAELVLVWSVSKPERALSIARTCVSLLEKEDAHSASGSSPLPLPSTAPGPGRSSCLNAIVVALSETCDGKSWYTSTKELQLASLGFCTACRNHQTVHLKVDEHIPRRLLAAADAPPPASEAAVSDTRAPTHSASCDVEHADSSGIEEPCTVFAMTDVDHLEFGWDFEGNLEAVAWPRWLKTIDLHPWSNFGKPIDLIEWPDSLQTLEFGWEFYQPIYRVNVPASLQQLIC